MTLTLGVILLESCTPKNMRIRMRTSLFYILLCSLLLLPIYSSAQTTDQQSAAFHSKNGRTAMASRNFATALTEYVIAYALDPSPQWLVQIGHALEGIGNESAAAKVYRRVVVLGKRGQAVKNARKRLAALRAASQPARSAITQVTLTVLPPGGTILIDGKKHIGMGPVSLRSGQHSLEIRMAGYKTHRETLNVGIRAMARVITLMPGTGVNSVVRAAPAVTTKQSITIIGIPSGAKVTLNKQRVPVMGPIASKSLDRPGRYTVIVRHPSIATFARTLNIKAGENPSIQVTAAASATNDARSPLPQTSKPTAGSLAGRWYAAQLGEKSANQLHPIATLELKPFGSELAGAMVIYHQKFIPRWKQRQCRGQTLATWTTRYQATLTTDNDGKSKLVAIDGESKKCSCPGLCNSSDSIDFDLNVATSNNAFITKNMVFLRHDRGAIPRTSYKSKVSPGELTGPWTVRFQDSGSRRPGRLTLTASVYGLEGRLKISTISSIPRWKQRECRGESELTMTRHFTVAGNVDGDYIDFEFNHDKNTNCSCNKLCVSKNKSVSSGKLRLTRDGNHLVGLGTIASR
ncbi:MAG TPA: PEGA domain-containing protein [Myxococcales bacterium]|nr:PEGA domain-containing protein [Myxococcales bacterium]HIN85540.1 PEGA domain-containing protein [Myxococcales bacterium]